MELHAVGRDLWRRRVPQILGAYFGAGLALLPFVESMLKRYSLPERLFEAFLVGFVSMIPSVFLLAYNHGAPGPDPWRRFERVGVPLNLMLTAAFAVLVFFSGPGVAAMTETVTVTDGDGRQESHLVPKEEFRKKLALFAWDEDSSDAELEWLRYGLPLMLERDLRQNRFLDVRNSLSDGFLTKLTRAGYEDALGIPIPLQQEVTREGLVPFFVAGRFGRDGGSFRVRIELYDSEDATRLAEHEVAGEDPVVLIDELALRLKKDLGIRDFEDMGRDLPVSEHLSASLNALEAWVRARVARRVGNDYTVAQEHLSRALELDPSFAIAHLEVADALLATGKAEEAIAALREVNKHGYRLTEQEVYRVRSHEIYLKGETDKAVAVTQRWSQLYPEDLEAWQRLGTLHLLASRLEEAVAAYQRILELDPSQDETLKQLGDLYMGLRRYGEALEVYGRFAQLHPGDHPVQLSLARVERLQGKLDAAKQRLEEATLMASSPTATLSLIELDLAVGDFEAAEGRIAEARDLVTLPQDQAQVLSSELQVLSYRGQIRSALELVPRLRKAQAQYLNPIMAMIFELNLMELYGFAGREAEARRRLEEARQSLQPPLDLLVGLGELLLAMGAEDTEAIEDGIPKAQAFLEKFPDPGTEVIVQFARGQVVTLRGQSEEASAIYQAALEQLDKGSLTNAVFELRAQLLIKHARTRIDVSDLEAAALDLEEVLRMSPAHPGAHVQMARLEEARGDRGKAAGHLDQAMLVWAEADPDYPQAVEARELKAELGS